MKEIQKEQFVRDMCAERMPVETAAPGERLRLFTYDCYTNFTDDPGQNPLGLNDNPATGPVYVQGAQPGDTLAVRIIDIIPADTATMRIYPGVGAMGNAVTHEETKKIPLRDGFADMDGVQVPLCPMVGVIGVAPKEGSIDNSTPGRHGGNMDDRRITKGATVYLPVQVPGALLALGDIHAQMGDGEVAICGLEAPAEVVVELALIKGRQEEWPVVEKGGVFAVNCSAKTLDEAAELARYQLLSFLQKRTKMDANALVRLLSVAGDLSICQVVDPLVTARMALRGGILPIEF